MTLRSRFLLVCASLALMLTSCVKDAEYNINVEQWTGSWTCNEIEGDFAPQTYQVEIIEKVDYGTLSVRGLYNQGQNFSVEANVIGNAMDIPNQTIDGISISGSGFIEGDEITLDFDANDGSGVDEVSAILYR